MPDNSDRDPAEPAAMDDTPAAPPAADAATPDPNDEIPVPVAMTAAEIDERAQVVEALRGKAPVRPDDDEFRA